MVLVVFRFRINPAADPREFEALGQHLYEHAASLAGFIGIQEYRSPDGEFVNLVEFADMDAVNRWKVHPQHVLAKQRACEFMSEYKVQVCDVTQTLG